MKNQKKSEKTLFYHAGISGTASPTSETYIPLGR